MDKKFQVLIVEDEAVIAVGLQSLMEEFGYDAADFVSTAEEAVKAARETNPDLILMDIKLPGNKDGIETAKEIRAFLKSPVIFLSGYIDKKTCSEARKIPGCTIIYKPFDIAELKLAIKTALRKNDKNSC